MATGRLPLVRSADELAALVMEIGFLPLCHCAVEGFSVQDCTPEDMWFVRDVVGPWEWRETIADQGVIVYGKLLAGKAAFVSPAFYPDFVNWRRGGMPFAARYEAGLVSRMEKQIMDLIAQRGPMLSRDIRSAVGEKGLDRATTLLQMRTDLAIQRFEYSRDAFGRPYGMGVSRFAPSELVLGEAIIHARAGEPPEVSKQRLVSHVAARFPDASEKNILRVLRW